jgi:NADPH2:quinone reductase
MTAAGVTPLDHTILSGSFPMAQAPLVLGNEGAGVVEGSGGGQFPDGSRVMFTGPYGVFENGAFGEWVAVKKEHLCLVPENIGDDVAQTFPLEDAAEALRYLVEGRPFGRVLLSI